MEVKNKKHKCAYRVIRISGSTYNNYCSLYGGIWENEKNYVLFIFYNLTQVAFSKFGFQCCLTNLDVDFSLSGPSESSR